MTVAVAVQDGPGQRLRLPTGRLEAWLSGTADRRHAVAASASGRTVLTGTVGAAGVDGTVTIDGAESAYTAAATDVATAAGQRPRPTWARSSQRLGGTG